MGNTDIVKKLNESVLTVVADNDLQLFEKAYLVAEGVSQLKVLLTPEYMKPIMQLQGNRLGFKTDKDSAGGYAEAVVKNCVIEAVLTGVQVAGNQFNIIAGNCYITKEGFGYLLKKVPGLSYDITFELPRINPDKTSAAIVAIISWNFKGEKREKRMEVPIRMNSGMGTDAVIGKATRKARAWLYNTITGSEVGDGDIEDAPSSVVGSRVQKSPEEKEVERKLLMLSDCKTKEDVELLQASYPDWDITLFDKRKEELNAGK